MSRRRLLPFFVRPCDDEDGRTWDVIRRSDGVCVQQQIIRRADARHIAFIMSADLESAQRRAAAESRRP